VQQISVQAEQAGISPVHWFRDAITGSTVVIAIATVVNLGVSVGLWLSTRDSVEVARHVFETANRPYVGTETVFGVIDRDKHILNFTAQVKNSGTVPAENTDIAWEVSLNGIAQPGIGVPSNPSILFPNDHVSLHGGAFNDQFDKIMNGQITLTIVLRASYNGPSNKTYQYCNKHRYEPSINLFMNLGVCDNTEKPTRKG
jgi:hypothetical protein